MNTRLYLANNIEPCPFCGTLLSDVLQQRQIVQSRKKLETVFQKASKIPKLTLDIPELDSQLPFLTTNQKICISGIHTQNIVERICVRAQLPIRYGGLDTKILLIDGANSSDLYQCVDYAYQYDLDIQKILDGIISCRVFTVYQLAHVITTHLEDAIRDYGAKVIVISNLLHFFTNDPFLDESEMHRILKKIIKTLEKIQDCLIVISLEYKTKYDYMFDKLFTKKIRLEPRCGALAVCIDDKNTNCIVLNKDALDIIPNH